MRGVDIAPFTLTSMRIAVLLTLRPLAETLRYLAECEQYIDRLTEAEGPQLERGVN